MRKRQMSVEKSIISAVIVAAGSGRRMNMALNKQYIDIRGKLILARTLQVFEDCLCIDEIVVVVNEKDVAFCTENVVKKYGLDKVKAIVAGGEERQNSVYNGLVNVDNNCELVLIHDGARPLVTEENIEAGIEAAKEYGAASIAVPVKDTIKSGNSEGFVEETIDRSRLWAIQTPQIFKYELIMKAHKEAIISGLLGTDDAMLVERLGTKIKLVMGGYNNIKITTKEDLAIAEALLSE